MVDLKRESTKQSYKLYGRTYLTHNKLDFVDLVCRQRIVSDWTATQGAVEPVVASVADAGVELVTIPDLSANDNRGALHHSWPSVLCCRGIPYIRSTSLCYHFALYVQKYIVGYGYLTSL